MVWPVSEEWAFRDNPVRILGLNADRHYRHSVCGTCLIQMVIVLVEINFPVRVCSDEECLP